MFTLRKWLSTSASPRSIIISSGWTFLLSPSQECSIYIILMGRIWPELSCVRRGEAGTGHNNGPSIFRCTGLTYILWNFQLRFDHTLWPVPWPSFRYVRQKKNNAAIMAIKRRLTLFSSVAETIKYSYFVRTNLFSCSCDTMLAYTYSCYLFGILWLSEGK